jgi:putative transcriptional regulator
MSFYMPVVIEVGSIMAKRGFKSQLALAEASGINPSQIGPLVRGTARRIDLGTLDRLCAALSCQPGDLLKYQAD